jgi:4-hydroxy-tetrahydrodipicolinate synthase
MFKESIVAIVTPFNKDGIDISALEKLVERQIIAGTRGIVVCATTGEGTLLTRLERTLLVKETVRISGKRIPIIVGCSSSSTTESIEFAMESETLGADGILVMTPFYVKPSIKGIIHHFRQIHDAMKLPIIIYNHPGRSGIDLSIDILKELFKFDRIVSLKDSNTDLSRVGKLKKCLKKNDSLLSGDDPTAIDYLKEGGHGCISVTANILPKLCQDVMDMWFRGERKKAMTLEEKLAPFHEACVLESNPQPVKYALYKMGLISDMIRSPLIIAEKSTQDVMNKLIEKNKLCN